MNSWKYCSNQCARFTSLTIKWYMRRGITIHEITEDVKGHWLEQRNQVYSMPSEYIPKYAKKRELIKSLRCRGLTYREISRETHLGIETVIDVLEGLL